MIGRKELYGRCFVLPQLSSKNLVAHPRQADAKDSMRMRAPHDS
jgi:hypothetical protein